MSATLAFAFAGYLLMGAISGYLTGSLFADWAFARTRSNALRLAGSALVTLYLIATPLIRALT